MPGRLLPTLRDAAVLDHAFPTIDEAAGSVERPTTSPTSASRNKEES